MSRIPHLHFPPDGPSRGRVVPLLAMAALWCVVAAGSQAAEGIASPLVLADVDADGKKEVVLATGAGQQAELRVYDWSPNPGEGKWEVIERPLVVRTLPALPSRLFVGDLNADGSSDLAGVERTGLWWVPGPDLAGAELRHLPLPGRIDAAAAGELGRRDGLLDLAVALTTETGPELWLLQSGAGALRSRPVRVPLPAAADALAMGPVDRSRRGGVVAVADRHVVVVDVRDRVRPRVSLHALPFGWTEVTAAETPSGGPAIVVTARDGSRRRLEVLNGRLAMIPRAGRVAAGSAQVDGVLAIGRVNGDARSDLVVLGADGLPESHLRQGVHTFTVTSTGDGADATPGDGVCDDGTGACTLRAAIDEANAAAGDDDIRFDIPGGGPHTISPASPLPLIAEPVSIDGRTQPGYAGLPLVELDGSGAGNGVSGIAISAGGSTVAGLAINRFDGSGIELSGVGGNLVVACHLGTDPSGTVGLGNAIDGLDVIGGSGNVIGGTTAAERNVISGNDTDGINVTGADGTIITGNHIGTSADGGAAIPNAFFGIFIDGIGNDVGGTAAGSGNVISGNGETGVEIRSTSPGSADANLIQGNRLGVDASGAVALPNVAEGIRIRESRDNLIGGTTAPAGNVISANLGDGIFVRGKDVGDTAGLEIRGNVVGGDASGTVALGNGLSGILLRDAEGAVIGGVGSGNVIVGNGDAGVHLLGDAHGARIEDNLVGIGLGGEPLGNTVDGIRVEGANDAVVAGNTVAHNLGTGLVVLGVATRNRLTHNATFDNGALAIDLTTVLPPNGVTVNDAGDGDTGPNDLQNHPVLTEASRCDAGTLRVAGTLDSSPSTAFTIELFASPTCDGSGWGEGEVYLGTLPVSTDGSGHGVFTGSVPGSVPVGWVVTATAIDPAGNTSEMSLCQAVADGSVGEVGTLSYDASGMQWPAVANASEYRIYRGGLEDLPALLTSDVDSCRVWSGAGTSAMDVESPAPGKLFWYLVVAVNDCGEGPAGNTTSGPRMRDGSAVCGGATP